MTLPSAPPPERGLFCNRTLNMRAIKAVGYDMDYTLIHYRVEAWEQRAYEHMREQLVAKGWPVGHLQFDPGLAMRGLIIDTLKGNLLKANRFGFVKRALHGTKPLEFERQRTEYSRTLIDLAERRWVFLNTLFSLSEGCLYAQLVELLDAGKLPGSPMGYADLYEHVRRSLDATHMAGALKAEIVADPDRFVLLDPDVPLALLDQKHAGKKLLLITNSEWAYTAPMMRYSFDRFLPKGMTWRDLFDVVIVSARKPEFFTTRSPLFEVATEEGLLRPHQGPLKSGVPYLGGSAVEIERTLGLSGDEILYVGDHMFGDVHVTKNVLRWRTALIVRELEDEVRSIAAFRATEQRIAEKMEQKERLEAEAAQVRLELQRRRDHYGPRTDIPESELHARALALRAQLEALDAEIAPLVRAGGELSNPSWGLLSRAGNDKSHLARQIERYADIYTSRVSNFLFATPFVYLRSPRGSLPHDPTLPGGTPVFGSAADSP
ncbi:HAD-IG family 5'-nucleotidase [Aggregicoccus sp. 17bor-14]|uniref:HAD-IG family 5'-nucleotidase n=1 Tax=Myxococcaceae TaxID=31 RepID=UPI00129CF3E9|nr:MULTISPECIES: HAD-IG family 5'-nucleotidase [Myxococcaceae]MBF5045686.1 HAD-IG family 5'-nucleotidase [Simulacricoccus sp. 17bor-14]MRI91423.1 HAD-IG family 5'-nucleotidase [Aggregicoccus sp. 17bor-14]